MKVLPLLALLSTTAVPAAAPIDDCPDCAPGVRKAELCAPHAEAEKAGLAGCSAGLRKDTPAERLAALRELAALTDAHANAPSPALVKVLARGLADESGEVLLGTIELLAGQHPEAVLGAYGTYVKKLAKRYADLTEDAGDVRHRQELRRLKEPAKDSTKQRRQEAEDREELGALEAEMEVLDRATEGISAQLAGMRDDRAVNLLATLLEQNARDATWSALAELGNADATEVVLETLERHAELFEVVAGLKDTLEEAADLTGKEPAASTDEIYEAALKPVAAAHAALTRIAESAGLAEGLPELNAGVFEAWKTWVKRNGKSLPPSFGRMSMPWDE